MNKQGSSSLLGLLPGSCAASMTWFHFHKTELDHSPSFYFFFLCVDALLETETLRGLILSGPLSPAIN